MIETELDFVVLVNMVITSHVVLAELSTLLLPSENLSDSATVASLAVYVVVVLFVNVSESADKYVTGVLSSFLFCFCFSLFIILG